MSDIDFEKKDKQLSNQLTKEETQNVIKMYLSSSFQTKL